MDGSLQAEQLIYLVTRVGNNTMRTMDVTGSFSTQQITSSSTAIRAATPCVT
jgi:hypothetical protein